MSVPDQIEINILQSLANIEALEWDSCACPEAKSGGRALDPFTTHRFLLALEQSGSVGTGTGWQPQYLTAKQNGELIGVAPLYAKSHSQGEYIFDFNLAQSFETNGGRYYPKLQIAVPFTPATGRRFLTRPGHEITGTAALIEGAVQIAGNNGLSSLHVTFCTEAEALAGEAIGLLRRQSQQFHWVNEGYQSFEDFLGALSSRKRKAIRKERRIAQGFGGRIITLTGDALCPEHWQAFWQFYQDTGQRKWGAPYLTRDFFEQIQQYMRDDVLLILALVDDVPVAGALNFIGRETLFGRYWGCSQHHPCLHFELCYYAAIEAAIEMGLSRVEAGAQGEHKLARGYLPVETHSLHWFADPGFSQAVARYFEAEKQAVENDIEVLTSYGPFRREDHPEHD